ncbi:MAG: type II toxin-antitoxin system HicB family antitoxin [Magnetococcales bacterium]|nr:type II toxin-antitoxin system HicB family antitoxin [Magnetococcales bacterium]
MDIRYYPAVLYRSGRGVGVVFPDLDGCVSYGATDHAAAVQAEEAATAHVALMLKQGAVIPPPSHLDDVAADPDGEALGKVLIRIEVPCKWVRVNISMDERLLRRADTHARDLGMTRSGYLAEAVRRMAGV